MKTILAAMIIAVALLGCEINTEYVMEKEYHVVHTGETLWEIAGDRMEKQDRHKDIRNLIHDICEANGLGGKRGLQAGDCIEIPLYKEIKK